MAREDEYRRVNQVLGKSASFGPIPAEHLFPWIVISVAIFIICNRVLSAPGHVTIALVVWGCGTWWVLTGSRPWRFLANFVKVPHWTKYRKYYRSIYWIDNRK